MVSLRSAVLFWMSGLVLVPSAVRGDIVGGEPVHLRDGVRKSTVALYDPKAGALCTASLLDQDIAVTAAHCLGSARGSRSVVLFGDDLHRGRVLKRQVVAQRVHERRLANPTGMDEGDIALVRFEGGIPEGYAPVSGIAPDSALRRGRTAVLAGYGISNARTHEGAGVLRKTRVRIANGRLGMPEMILDQSHGHGACHGDSGGPAFVRISGKSMLAGLTNRSYPVSAPDDCGHQVVYTKVAAYRSWIAQGEKELRARKGGLRYRSRGTGRVSPSGGRVRRVARAP